MVGILIALWVEASGVWLETEVNRHVPLLLVVVLLLFYIELLFSGVKDWKLEVSAEVYVDVIVLLLTYWLWLLLLTTLSPIGILSTLLRTWCIFVLI